MAIHLYPSELVVTVSDRKPQIAVAYWGFPGGSEIKNLPINAGDIREPGLMPCQRRSPGGGHGNPLQYSCLENPMDRGAWQAIVTKTCTLLKKLSMHTSTQ